MNHDIARVYTPYSTNLTGIDVGRELIDLLPDPPAAGVSGPDHVEALRRVVDPRVEAIGGGYGDGEALGALHAAGATVGGFWKYDSFGLTNGNSSRLKYIPSSNKL